MGDLTPDAAEAYAKTWSEIKQFDLPDKKKDAVKNKQYVDEFKKNIENVYQVDGTPNYVYRNPNTGIIRFLNVETGDSEAVRMTAGLQRLLFDPAGVVADGEKSITKADLQHYNKIYEHMNIPPAYASLRALYDEAQTSQPPSPSSSADSELNDPTYAPEQDDDVYDIDNIEFTDDDVNEAAVRKITTELSVAIPWAQLSDTQISTKVDELRAQLIKLEQYRNNLYSDEGMDSKSPEVKAVQKLIASCQQKSTALV
ncbi:hypothetical protein CAOG_006669 [Capsaspora owczarzaki ATCC 30864]|uniref:Uncharacterized protein n=1 Tax=Capsaspora owczarzaki (strain ATCC 30864) TaxID=595528 RepID=A0A0D2WVP0_CAPO3|nr:hypothetical protein CAOG_006669 [Capsaspora owczarzaki ATCC 30864]